MGGNLFQKKFDRAAPHDFFPAGKDPVGDLFQVNEYRIAPGKTGNIVGGIDEDAGLPAHFKTELREPHLLPGKPAVGLCRQGIFDPEIAVSGQGALKTAEKNRQTGPGGFSYTGQVPVALRPVLGRIA
jgi:hypothetical protein